MAKAFPQSMYGRYARGGDVAFLQDGSETWVMRDMFFGVRDNINPKGFRQLKYWNGTEWVSAPLKRWNGVTWQEHQLRAWKTTDWFPPLAVPTRVALLHMDGADLSTALANDAPGGVGFTAYGAAALKVANKKFGTAALDLSGGGYARSNGSLTLDGPFCFGFWVYRTGYTGVVFSIGNGGASPGFLQLAHYVNETRLLIGGVENTVNTDAQFGQPGDGWKWISVSRGDDDILRLASGGVQFYSVLAPQDFTGKVAIGTSFSDTDITEDGGGASNMLFDDFLIEDGIPVYSSFPYTPPTSALT